MRCKDTKKYLNTDTNRFIFCVYLFNIDYNHIQLRYSLESKLYINTFLCTIIRISFYSNFAPSKK